MFQSLGDLRPRLRFAAVLAGFVGVVLLTYREEVLGSALAPLTSLTAQMTLALLRLTGIAVEHGATYLYHPEGFGYEIYFRCTGFLPVAFLTVSILAYPALPREKCLGLAVGVPLLVALNLIRLVHLFYVGVYQPALFDFVHAVAWEGSIILAIIVIWLRWTMWAGSTESGLRFGSGRRLLPVTAPVSPVSESGGEPALP